MHCTFCPLVPSNPALSLDLDRADHYGCRDSRALGALPEEHDASCILLWPERPPNEVAHAHAPSENRHLGMLLPNKLPHSCTLHLLGRAKA